MRLGEDIRTLEGTLMLDARTGAPAGADSSRRGGESTRLVRGAVMLERGRIARVEVDERTPIDPRRIICPGFIDAHLHIPQFDAIGHDGLTLLDWLNDVIFPAERRWEDAAFARAMAARVAKRLLSHGTTGICAYGTVHHEGTRAAMESLAAAGLRGSVGQVLMDQSAPDYLLRPAAQLIDEAARMERVGRIEPIVSPRFAVSCSMALMRGAAKLAREKDWPIQTHLAEMLPECELVERLHGMPYVDVYKQAGLLGRRTVLAHGIWLSEVDRRELEGWRCVIAHCPTANRFLSSGDFAGQKFRPLALGSDVAGGPDVSMVRVARAAREVWLASLQSQAAPMFGPDYWWWQITAGNADALGWSDAGRIAVGAAADLVVVEPDVELRSAGSDAAALGQLMYGWDERWIAATVCEGRVAWTRGG
ncbi:MAG: amidohydrolase family protein [Phycisphaeraceae bacterium]|nr:amidohydrolase family protein [Phycisphaeraceae bacterium]MBX3406180.1 amidohydrolase family protein [Phycisphaeraceae bacterium]